MIALCGVEIIRHRGNARSLLYNVGHFESLSLAQWSAFRNDNFVANSQIVPVRIGKELLAHAEALAVHGMQYRAMHRHGDGVLHAGRCDDALFGSHEEDEEETEDTEDFLGAREATFVCFF